MTADAYTLADLNQYANKLGDKYGVPFESFREIQKSLDVVGHIGNRRVFLHWDDILKGKERLERIVQEYMADYIHSEDALWQLSYGDLDW